MSGQSAEPLRLLAVAPLHWTSGYDDLLVGMATAVEAGADVTLVVEADGPAEERFRYTTDDLGLGARVVLTRPGGGPARADVLVHTPVADAAVVLGPALARVAAALVSDLPGVLASLPGTAPPARTVPRRAPAAIAAALLELAGNGSR